MAEKTGEVSWYGPGFHGRKTASGERFDQNGLTAASRTLPLGSFATVTDPETNKSVKVRINDRGPYRSIHNPDSGKRLLDLSKGAMKELGLLKKGVATLRVSPHVDENAGVNIPGMPTELLGPTGRVFLHEDGKTYSTHLNTIVDVGEGRSGIVPLLVPNQERVGALIRGEKPTAAQKARVMEWVKANPQQVPTYPTVDAALAAEKQWHEWAVPQMQEHVQPHLGEIHHNAEPADMAAPTGAPQVAPGAAGPTSEDLDRIRAFIARPDVPDEAKSAAVASFSQQHPLPAAAGPAIPGTPGRAQGPLTRIGAGGVPLLPTTMEQPPAGVPPPITPPPAGDTIRGVPATEVIGEAAIQGAGIVGSQLAFIPAFEGAGLLMTAARTAAGIVGGVGARALMTHVARPSGKAHTGEYVEEAIADGLPILAHGLARPLILTPSELRAFAGETAAITKPIPALLPEKPAREVVAMEKPTRELVHRLGRPPAPAAPPGVPEITPGVSAGAFEPIPIEPTVPQVGPQWTKATTTALKATERESGQLYDAGLRKAEQLGLAEPVPQHIVQAASDALDQLDASTLDPQSKSAARRVLESVRNIQGEVNAETGEIIVRKGKEPVTRVTYSDLDAWRRKLQETATGFEAIGIPQSFEKGSVGHLLGLVKDEMKRMAAGTEVEALHRVAEEHLINEVRPMQKLMRMVFRGEAEPNQLVDMFTSKAHTHQFARWMTTLDREAPGLAQRVRTAKLQSMVEHATRRGTFSQETFLKDLHAMTPQTQRVLLGGGAEGDINQFVHNIHSAQATGQVAQADAQAVLEAAHGRAMATHEQARAVYEAAAARYHTASAGYEREVLAVKQRNAALLAQHKMDTATVRRSNEAAESAWNASVEAADAELKRARRKVSKQAMVVGLSPAGLSLYEAATSAIAGKPGPFMQWMAGGAGTEAAIGWMMSRPGTVKATNALFRVIAAGGSPSTVARLGTQLVSHLFVGYSHAVLAPAESHANLPPTASEADAASLERFSTAVPAAMP